VNRARNKKSNGSGKGKLSGARTTLSSRRQRVNTTKDRPICRVLGLQKREQYRRKAIYEEMEFWLRKGGKGMVYRKNVTGT